LHNSLINIRCSPGPARPAAPRASRTAARAKCSPVVNWHGALVHCAHRACPCSRPHQLSHPHPPPAPTTATRPQALTSHTWSHFTYALSKSACGNFVFFFFFQGSAFPKLQKLARRVLCIPASSAASKRHFSNAGFVLNDRRSKLSTPSLDAIMFLHHHLANLRLA